MNLTFKEKYMTRIFGMAGTMVVALLFAVETIPAQPGVLVEADSDTVMKIKYTGSNPVSAAPALLVTGKHLGAIVEGTGRALTGRISGYALPLTGLPSGIDAAGPIGISAYGTGELPPV